MILYQDTSSIIKRYVVDEEGVEDSRRAVDVADALATSVIAVTEVRSALARAQRTGRFVDADEYASTLTEFLLDWRSYAKLAASQTTAERAGDLAERHALKAYDAIHLASALTLHDVSSDSVRFSCWDVNLNRAASSEGLDLAH